MSSLPSQWQRPQITREDTSQRSERTRTASIDIGIDMGEKEETSDSITAIFRQRYTQYEKTIHSLFKTDRPCCAAPELDLSTLELNDNYPSSPTNPAASSVPDNVRPPARQLDDDDYDFDDDDEDEEPKKSAPSPLLAKALSSHSQSSEPSRNIAEAKKNATATREKLEADRKAAEEAARSALSTMFFTLENDRDAMLEQQKLEESDRQVNAEANAAQANAPGKLSSANLGASSLTLKHLIARIDAKREKVKVSDMELRNLMSEVRKNRSKWANEDKVGQEELYEAAEKVVLELRALTEHSTAFLNRVNKREAPDYFSIIKHPMDLGTVMKKLKTHQYKSKKEFVDDLNLIWANCLAYNADPMHYLRKHAKCMQKATQNLIPLIPDIVIRDRAEVEAEEAGTMEVDAEGESDDEPLMSSRGRKAPGTKKARKGARTEGTPEIKPPTVHLLRADSLPPGESSQVNIMQNGFLTPLGGTPVPNGISGTSMSQMEIDHDKVDDDSNDVEYQAWKTMTKKARAKVASDRHKLLRGNRLNPEEPALLRSRTAMGRYLKNEERHLKILQENEDEGLPRGNGNEKLVDSAEGDEGDLLPDYYNPLSCVPELPWRLVWYGDSDEVDLQGQDMKLALKGIFTQPKSELSKRMDANIRQMQDTRKLCSKIAVIKQMQVQTQMYSNQFQRYDPKEFIEADVEDFVVTEEGPIMCHDVARAALQRSVGKIFFHAGFEEYQPTAIDAVTDIAADYIQKLSKTLMVYAEAPSHERQFSPEEMLLHALYENGADVESLEAYIRDDVERLGSRLNGIHERMKFHLTELLRPALTDTGGDGSRMFNDGSEMFVGGDFAEDIGDDFFGFKELGLDKEFGLSSLSVPLHLLQGRMRSTFQNPSASAAVSADGYKQPPPFEPVTHEIITKQIGLVQNFFLAKLHANNEEALIEDEHLQGKQKPPKPRLPPTGKISMPRKRPSNSHGGNSKKKKKPNPAPASTKTALVKDAHPALERTLSKISEGGDEGNGGMMSPESLVGGGG